MSSWNTGEAAQHNLQFEVAIGEAVIEVYTEWGMIWSNKELVDLVVCLHM